MHTCAYTQCQQWAIKFYILPPQWVIYSPPTAPLPLLAKDSTTRRASDQDLMVFPLAPWDRATESSRVKISNNENHQWFSDSVCGGFQLFSCTDIGTWELLFNRHSKGKHGMSLLRISDKDLVTCNQKDCTSKHSQNVYKGTCVTL